MKRHGLTQIALPASIPGGPFCQPTTLLVNGTFSRSTYFRPLFANQSPQSTFGDEKFVYP